MTTQSITYEIDEARFMRACHALWAYRAMGRVGNYITAGVVGLCAGFLVWQGVPGLWATLLFVGVIAFVIMDQMRERLWRRHYQNLTKYRAPLTATVGPDGVAVMGDEGSNHLPWTYFRHYARADDFLFLIIDQRQFSVIPIDAFETSGHATSFEGVLANHLKRLPRKHF